MGPGIFEHIEGFSTLMVILIGAASTLIGAGFGVGITWATLRNKVNKSSEALSDVRKEIQLLKEKIETLEEELRSSREAETQKLGDLPKTYVLGSHCVKIREQLAGQFCRKVDEVKDDIGSLKGIIPEFCTQIAAMGFAHKNLIHRPDLSGGHNYYSTL